MADATAAMAAGWDAVVSSRHDAVRIVGSPSIESDAAVARFLSDFLQAEHPGTAWRIRERGKHGSRGEAAAGEVDGASTGGVDDKPAATLEGERVEPEPE